MAASKNIPKDYSNKNTYFKVPARISRIFFYVALNNRPPYPFGI